MYCLGCGTCKWLDILVFVYKDNKPQALSYASSLYWSVGNIRELMHFSQRVENLALGVVIWPCSKNCKNLGHLLNCLSKIVNQSMQSGQSPLQSVIKHIEAYYMDNVLYHMEGYWTVVKQKLNITQAWKTSVSPNLPTLLDILNIFHFIKGWLMWIHLFKC